MARKMTVKRRLTLGFAFVLLTMIVLTGIGILRVNSVARNLTEIADQYSVKQRHAINFRGSVHDRAISLRDIALVKSDAQLRQVLADIERLTDDYARNAKALDALIAQPETRQQERQAYAAIKAVELKAMPLAHRAIERQQAGDLEGLRQTLVDGIGPVFTEWLAVINAFIDLQESQSQDAAAEAMSISSSFQMEMLVLCFIALVLSALQASLITRKLLRELGAEPGELNEFTAAVGSGNLVVPEKHRQPSEGSVMSSLVAMAGVLRDVVTSGRQTAQSVALATQQLIERNNDLLARTENQASGLTETASAMEELGSTVSQNAGNAAQADQLATGAVDVAQRGGQVMRTVIDTMGNVNSRSREIAEIIGIIDSIAFQTNILALNASVEAARAGTQGRGFAVVASEVRSLAQRSADAAKNIKTLIMENLQWVDSGTRQVNDAGHAMEEIVSSIRQVAEIMSEISRASVEQSSGVQQVSQAVIAMDRDTEHNRDFVAESARAAVQLREQADHLAETLAFFQLEEQKGTAPYRAGQHHARGPELLTIAA